VGVRTWSSFVFGFVCSGRCFPSLARPELIGGQELSFLASAAKDLVPIWQRSTFLQSHNRTKNDFFHLFQQSYSKQGGAPE
jgi:hypothetical protein